MCVYLSRCLCVGVWMCVCVSESLWVWAVFNLFIDWVLVNKLKFCFYFFYNLIRIHVLVHLAKSDQILSLLHFRIFSRRTIKVALIEHFLWFPLALLNRKCARFLYLFHGLWITWYVFLYALNIPRRLRALKLT